MVTTLAKLIKRTFQPRRYDVLKWIALRSWIVCRKTSECIPASGHCDKEGQTETWVVVHILDTELQLYLLPKHLHWMVMVDYSVKELGKVLYPFQQVSSLKKKSFKEIQGNLPWEDYLPSCLDKIGTFSMFAFPSRIIPLQIIKHH